MLDDVIGAYLESIEEREFDEPFMALLRVHGYYDLHFLQGPFEFGKDFIAKRVTNGVVEQCSFQTKAGNLALREWREERGQIDDMRTTVLAHPSFDEGLPKVVVLVTTGRMVGQAAVNAQQYKPYVAKHHSESFELWDRESLIELMRLAPEVGLGR